MLCLFKAFLLFYFFFFGFGFDFAMVLKTLHLPRSILFFHLVINYEMKFLRTSYVGSQGL